MNTPSNHSRGEVLRQAVLRRLVPSVLAGLLALATLVWAFVKLSGAVVEGDTQAWDTHIVEWLRSPENPKLPRGPLWLVEAGRDLTALGGVTVMTLLSLAAAGYLLLQRKCRAMVLMLLAIASGLILSTLLKSFYERPRPPTPSALAQVFTSSFPSGHSMLSAIVYLVLGTMLARMETDRRTRVYLFSLALLLTLLVGLSRVYLGVHYPSDVLAGWIAGLAWALMWWFIAKEVERRAEPHPTAGDASRGGQS